MSAKLAGKLFFQRRFAPLFVLMQTGTFNDNALKNALIALITFGGVAFLSDLPSAIRVPVAAMIYTGPFLLICAIAGQIADKIDRGDVFRWIKRAEIIIMLIAAIGFLMSNIWILAFSLALMGAQSAFISPTKNAVLPQWLTNKELITGNAILNGFVFVFILVGQVVGTLLVLKVGGPKIVAAILFLLAIIGWIASEYCPPAPTDKPDLKINYEPVTATWNVLKIAFDAPDVLRPLLGIAWFYGLSTVFITTFPDLVASDMRYDANVLIVILVLSTIAILVGSMITMLIGDWKIWRAEAVGLSTIGITGVTIFTLILSYMEFPKFAGPADTLGTVSDFFANPKTKIFLAFLFLASACNALFVVPLQAMAQRRSDPAIRARLMSAGAVLLNLFVNLATFGLIALAARELPPKTPFLMVVIISALVAIYAMWRSWHPVNRITFMDN